MNGGNQPTDMSLIHRRMHYAPVASLDRSRWRADEREDNETVDECGHMSCLLIFGGHIAGTPWKSLAKPPDRLYSAGRCAAQYRAPQYGSSGPLGLFSTAPSSLTIT